MKRLLPSPPPPEGGEMRLLRDVQFAFQRFDAASKNRFLAELLATCDVETLVHVSNLIAPRIKRDFFKDLPIELSLHILSFLDDPKTLARASAVSRFWRFILSDEHTWRNMCQKHNFGPLKASPCSPRAKSVRALSWVGGDADSDACQSDEDMLIDDGDARMDDDDSNMTLGSPISLSPQLPSRSARYGQKSSTRPGKGKATLPSSRAFSYKDHFKTAYVTGIPASDLFPITWFSYVVSH